MVDRTWLVLDMHNLAWRAFHRFHGLEHDTKSTGVIYGVMRAIQTLTNEHATRHVVFCFDSQKSLRQEAFKDYKSERRNKVWSDEEQVKFTAMRRQILLLRNKILPRLGYKNVFHCDGYEADDIIASVVGRIRPKEEAVIVSTDKDMFQLLRHNVLIWHPTEKKTLSAEGFRNKYGIHPPQWAMVKALAGCKSDGVPGIRGIGETLAVGHLKGNIDPFSKPGKSIRLNADLVARNLKLVRLPFKGCPRFKLDRTEKINPLVWRRVAEEYGMTSIANKGPSRVVGFGMRPDRMNKYVPVKKVRKRHEG